MKGNRELDKLLISYILNELNAEEETLVVEHINSDEKNREHFESLLDTWRLLAVKQEVDKIEIDEEWKHFEQTIAREKQKLISIKKQQDFKDKVEVEEIKIEEESINRRGIVKKILVSIAIAASVITLIVLAWNFSTDKEPIQEQLSKSGSGKTELPTAFVRHEINNSGKSKKLELQDGSVIVLSDKSEISFEEPFTGNRRDITLKGRADFKVAKDKSKPFTVYSLALSTTALGTHFTVSAFENAANIFVRLYEGKILVKSILSIKTRPRYEEVLMPGEEFVYSNKDYTAKVLNFNARNLVLKDNNKVEILNEDPALPENKEGSWNMFNNQSLEDVFNQLKVLYNVNIVYSKRDVQNKYFIGKYDKSDSLNYILNQIASLNNFKVTKKNNRYFITK